MDSFTPTPRTTFHRVPARGSYDRALVYGILDEGLWAAVGFVADGQPFVLPMAYARLDDQLLLHGARASRLLQHLGDGAPVCATVTLIDGVVLARSAFSHSLNYRSVAVLGQARPLATVEEKRAAMAALVEHVLPGRGADVRPPSDKELAATAVLALPIVEASAKVRQGGPRDDEQDLTLACWAGHVPLRLVADAPVPDVGLAAGTPLPAALARYRRGP